MCNESALCYPAASSAPIASRRSLLIRQPWSPIGQVLDTLDFWVKDHRRTQTLAWVSKYSKSPTREPSRCELLKMQTCVPSVSGMNEIAACPPSQSITLLVCSLHARHLCQLLYCTTVLFKVLYYKIKNVLFFVIVFYVLFV